MMPSITTRGTAAAALAVAVAVAAALVGAADAFASPLPHRRTTPSPMPRTTTSSLHVQQQQSSQPQFYDADGNPVSMPMVYDANGNLVPFNPVQQPPAPSQPQAIPPQQQMQQPPQLMQQGVNPGTPSAAIEPPLPPRTKGGDSGPRPVGYNPDAFTMSNTADVYFAQLKQDSKVRKLARMAGDVERANRVFADDSVREIGESWNENPYTKEKNLAEARAEIEGTIRLQVQGSDDPSAKTYSGVSYRERLEQAKRARKVWTVAGAGSGKGVVVGEDVTAKVEVERPAAKAPPEVETPPPVVKAAEASPKEVPATPSAATTAVSSAPATPAGPADEEDVRSKVRTLQGLLLKHRGGPGFGAGRLRAPEAERLEDTLGDVLDALRSEVGAEGASGEPAAAAEAKGEPAVKAESEPVAKAEDKPAVKTEEKPVAVEAEAAAPASPAVEPKPAMEQKPAIEKQPVAQPPPPLAAQEDEDPLAKSVAQVEAALRKYKESGDPSEREDVVMEFRAALMAAASATDRAIIDSETKKSVVTEAGPASTAAAPAAPSMGFPETYAVTKPEQDVAPGKTTAPPAAAAIDTSGMTDEDKRMKLAAAVAKMDTATMSSLIDSGVKMDEGTTDAAFWTVVRAVDRAEAEDEPMPEEVPRMLHRIFDADMEHLLTREKETFNVTCMQPDQLGANRIAMNSIFDDAAHKDLPLTEGRRCEDGNCCDECSRNIFPTFASDGETNFDLFPGIEQLTFNDLEKVPAATIIQFIRLIERVRRTIAYEYGLPLKTILPLQAYSRKYVAGTTQQGGGGGEGDFVILHTDEATHTGYHYSCVLYLSTQGKDFEGGNFVFNDPADEGAEQPDLSHLPFEEQIRRSGRKLRPYGPSRGAAVIFSSGWENMHEVEKITSGTRYAVPCFFTTCPVPEEAYKPPTMAVGKPRNDEMIADDWLHLLLAHREEAPHESLGRVKELLMKWHYLCTPLSEH